MRRRIPDAAQRKAPVGSRCMSRFQSDFHSSQKERIVSIFEFEELRDDAMISRGEDDQFSTDGDGDPTEPLPPEPGWEETPAPEEPAPVAKPPKAAKKSPKKK